MLNPISFRHRLHVTVRIFKQWQHPSRANHLRSTYRTSWHAIKRKIVPHPSFARITRTLPDCRIRLWNFFQWLFAIIHDFYPLVMEKHLTDVISQKPILSGSLDPAGLLPRQLIGPTYIYLLKKKKLPLPL